jgi:hypothetical protein
MLTGTTVCYGRKTMRFSIDIAGKTKTPNANTLFPAPLGAL